MLSLFAALVLLAPEVPPECQAPPTREVSSLSGFAQSSGSLSVGLDSVATWCFDSSGTWTGGNAPPKGKKAASTEPTADCAKAILSCEAAKASITPEARQLLFDALADIERPFLGVKYKPRRSGLAERPPEVAVCTARERSTLFAQAQARMDLARLASQVQSEYANYKTWLFSEGLKCAQAIARGEKDYTRRGIAVDTPTPGGGTQQVPVSPDKGSGAGATVALDVGARDPGGVAGTNGTVAGGTASTPGQANSPTAGRPGSGGAGSGGTTATGATSPGTAGAGGANSTGTGVATAGSAGAAGSNGATGMTGANAAAGPKGATGTGAANGATGMAGAQGTTGPNAATAGTTGTVGATGAGAANGATGIAGAKGATGPNAATGSAGTAGTVGATGTTGTGAATGATGTTGAAGTAGATAATGATGTAGTAGATGATGATGTSGATTLGSTAAGGAMAGSPGTGGNAVGRPGPGGTTAPGGALAGGTGTTAGNTGLGGTIGSGGTAIPLGGPTAERERALTSGMLEKWRYFFAEQHKIEQDNDWVSGFLASRELRECHCTQRPIPGDIVRRLETKDRVSQLEADDEKNTRCELCLLDAYPPWKVRAQKQCALALELSEFELGYLQRSDDGNGLPPRCIDAAKAKLSGKAPATVSGPLAQQPQQRQGGSAFIITRAPDAPPPIPSQGDFVKPSDYAPMPSREDGRVYVRIFTSAACVAEILPGPIQARTGDLLPVPTSARDVTVRGPCGGFVELYFGKEEKPRVSDSFARNQPLRIQLRP